jgi:hypothetical protein
MIASRYSSSNQAAAAAAAVVGNGVITGNNACACRYCGFGSVLCSMLLLVLSLYSLKSIFLSSGDATSNTDLFESIRHRNATTCQVATIFPFRAGCPQTCRRQVNETEPMYRMGLEWYFARPNQSEHTAYDRGVNYQCPAPFVTNFRRASTMMESIASTNIGVNLKIEERMHLSLSYLCCLRRNETDSVREVMYQWVQDQYPFSFDVQFESVECWHERHNSVTVIMVMNQNLKQALLDRGIPVEVDRSQQMPFHVTLFGVFRGAKQSLAAVDNIQGDIRNIYQLVTRISDTFQDKWTGENGGSGMTVHHAPYFSFDGVQHAGHEQELPPRPP